MNNTAGTLKIFLKSGQTIEFYSASAAALYDQMMDGHALKASSFNIRQEDGKDAFCVEYEYIAGQQLVLDKNRGGQHGTSEDR